MCHCVTVLCLVCAFAAQVLACLAFTSMCVTALLLGRRPNETQGRILAGVVAAACMVPCRVLLPKLYQSANAPLAAAMLEKAVGQARSGGKAVPSGAARAVSGVLHQASNASYMYSAHCIAAHARAGLSLVCVPLPSPLSRIAAFFTPFAASLLLLCYRRRLVLPLPRLQHIPPSWQLPRPCLHSLLPPLPTLLLVLQAPRLAPHQPASAPVWCPS